MIATKDNTKIGDRVRFKTVGGWYNSGIVKEMRKDSFLVEVDRSSATSASVTLPYLVNLICSESIKKVQEMYWRSIKDEKPPDGERVIMCMNTFGFDRKNVIGKYVFIGKYNEDKNITHWMPKPEEPSEKSPTYELNVDTFELREVDFNNKREWKKKGEDEMTIGEFCKLVDAPGTETIIFLDENGNQECQMRIDSPFLKKFLWNKKFKSVSAEGKEQFGIWGLED